MLRALAVARCPAGLGAGPEDCDAEIARGGDGSAGPSESGLASFLDLEEPELPPFTAAHHVGGRSDPPLAVVDHSPVLLMDRPGSGRGQPRRELVALRDQPRLAVADGRSVCPPFGALVFPGLPHGSTLPPHGMNRHLAGPAAAVVAE
jgi:hypothetical protein